MAEELTAALSHRANRGTPRGAEAVLAQARRAAADDVAPRPARRPIAIAVAAASLALVVVGVVLLATRRAPDSSPIATVPDTTTVPTTPRVTGEAGAADDVADLALAPGGTLWAATDVGVVVWDLETGSPTVFSEVDGLGGGRVDHVAVAADGTAWALGDSWLAHYDGAWTLLGDEVVDADILTPIGDMAVGPDGSLWVAAGGPDALIRVDADGSTTYGLPDVAGIETPWARSIAVDGAGTVWASTGESGLLAFDGEWRHLGIDDGLPSDLVGNVAVAADGSVWVGGYGLYGGPGPDVPAGGIARYDGTTWTVFTTADGLLSESGEVATGPGGAIWVIHGDLGLPEHGVSRYDGTSWVAYPGDHGGRDGGVVTADGMLWTASDDGIVGFDGTTTRRLVAGAEAVPPPAPPGPPLDFEPVAGLDAMRLSTSIGEIEFTTWVHPDGDEPPWPATETAHGVVGGIGPDGAMAWSADGITWTEIPFATDPDGWSDQSATDTDDLVVWSVNDGVARAKWDGSAWVDAEIHHDPRLDGAQDVVVGPQGIVVVRNAGVYVWDGIAFAEASRPPDPSLHTEPGAGCPVSSEGIMAELGPVMATDDGFVALAARSSADWQRFPVCEPIVWFSADGDEWVPLTDESPFGDGAVVRDVAVAGDRMVAAGGAVWVSDDGVTWDRAELDGTGVLQVAGSDRGWIAAGSGNTMWFSPDGRVWDGPYERPPGWGDIWNVVGVAMLDDRVIGVGELRVPTEQSAASGVVIGVFD